MDGKRRPPEVDAGVLGHVDLAGAAGGVAVAAALWQRQVLQRAGRQLWVAHAAVARHACFGGRQPTHSDHHAYFGGDQLTLRPPCPLASWAFT